MNKNELIARLQKYEWNDIECKKAQRGVPDDAYKTVSAFANTAGGRLVFGVKDTKDQLEIVGVLEVDKLQNDFLSALRTGDKLNRVICVKEDVITHEDKTLLVFYVPESPRNEKPVYLKGDLRQSYIRRGACDEQCTKAEIERFVRDASLIRYDSEVLESLPPKTFFDEGSVNWYRRAFNQKQPGRHETLGALEFLNEWGFVVENDDKLAPTRTGVLLFGKGKYVRQILPRGLVDYQRIDTDFDNWTPEKRWNDRCVFEENIVQTWLGLVEKYMRLAEHPFAIDAATLRRDDDPPDYISFREATINLLIHQDYGDHTRKPVIKFFKDRTLFWNPGDAFTSEAQLLEPAEKEVRNPAIVNAFRRIGLSDQAGTGIRSIYSNWRRLGNVPPQVKNNKAEKTFELVLLKEKLLTEEQILFQANLGVQLTEDEAAVFAYVGRTGSITLTDIKAVTGKNTRECRELAERLKTQVLLAQTGDTIFQLAGHLQAKFPPALADGRLAPPPTAQVEGSANANLSTESAQVSTPPSANLTSLQRGLLSMCEVPQPLSALQGKAGFGNRGYFKRTIITPLIDAKLLGMTKPDKPTARDQKYLLTEGGLRLVQLGREDA